MHVRVDREAHVPVARARVAPADPVALVPDPAALVRVPADPVVLAPVVPVVLRWEARVPVALAVRAPAADPVVREVPVVHAPADPEATVRTVNVVRRARSRAPVDAGTWMSCNRS